MLTRFDFIGWFHTCLKAVFPFCQRTQYQRVAPRIHQQALRWGGLHSPEKLLSGVHKITAQSRDTTMPLRFRNMNYPRAALPLEKTAALMIMIVMIMLLILPRTLVHCDRLLFGSFLATDLLLYYDKGNSHH